jgi:hypothetical protein
MSQKFLSHLYIHSQTAEIRCKAVPEAMPADDIPLHLCPVHGRPDDLPEHHIGSQRFLSVQSFGREKEILFPAVCRDQSLTQKHVIDELPIARF